MNTSSFRIKAKREFRSNYKDYITIAISALIIRFVILAPFEFLWTGWLTILSAVGAYIVTKQLKRIYRI